MKNFNDCTRKEQISRWENVLRVMQSMSPHERRRHFDMEQFGSQTDCGTIACAAGHCSLDPWFRRRGWKGKFFKESNWDGSVEMVLMMDDGKWMGSRIVEFFGPSEQEGCGTEIFLNDNKRPYGQVIREIKVRIKEMKATALQREVKQ